MNTINKFGVMALSALVVGLAGCRSTVDTKLARSAAGASTGPKAKADPDVKATSHEATIGPDQRVGVHIDLARAHESQGRSEAAVAEYQQAIELMEGPNATRADRPSKATAALAHRRLGGALDRLGRPTEAEVHYRAALKLAPDDVKVWNDAGYSAYLQGNWAEAERRLKTAAKLDPGDMRVQTNLGLALAAAGKDAAALEAFTRAGGPAVAQANLAFVLAGRGRADAARDHYRRALDLQPGLKPARDALARLDADAKAAASGPDAAQVADERANDVSVLPTSARPK